MIEKKGKMEDSFTHVAKTSLANVYSSSCNTGASTKNEQHITNESSRITCDGMDDHSEASDFSSLDMEMPKNEHVGAGLVEEQRAAPQRHKTTRITMERINEILELIGASDLSDDLDTEMLIECVDAGLVEELEKKQLLLLSKVQKRKARKQQENGSASASIVVQQQTTKNDMLPILNTPEFKPLSPRELASFTEGCPSQNLSRFERAGAAKDPLDLSTLHAGDWLKVLLHCRLTKGRHFDNMQEMGIDHILLPPNQFLGELFDPRQSTSFDYYAIKSKLFTKTSYMCGFRKAGTMRTSPYAAGSMEFQQNKDKATVGESITIVAKFNASVCTFNLGEHQISRDYNAYYEELANQPQCEERRGPNFVVNPDFANHVEALLSSERDKCCSMCAKFENVREAIKERWGDVLATKMEIGVAAVTERVDTFKSEESLNSAMSEFKREIEATCGDAGVGVEMEKRNSHYEKATREHRERFFTWEGFGWTNGGSVEPFDIAQHRHNPVSWRCTTAHSFIPIVDLLPPHLRRELDELHEEAEKERNGLTIHFRAKRPVVLVFGSTGVGKSSLCNMIYNLIHRIPLAEFRSHFKEGDGAKGMTFKSEKETYPAQSEHADERNNLRDAYPNLNFTLIDTVGLNEPDGKKSSQAEAVMELAKLINELKDVGGVSLVIMLVKKSGAWRPLQHDRDNYNLVVDGLLAGAPKVLLINDGDTHTGNRGYEDTDCKKNRDWLDRSTNNEKITNRETIQRDFDFSKEQDGGVKMVKLEAKNYMRYRKGDAIPTANFIRKTYYEIIPHLLEELREPVLPELLKKPTWTALEKSALYSSMYITGLPILHDVVSVPLGKKTAGTKARKAIDTSSKKKKWRKALLKENSLSKKEVDGLLQLLFQEGKTTGN